MELLAGLMQGASGVLDFVKTGFGIANYFRQGELQEEAWRREDTSYQRKVKDLQAAGLNPILAAGGGGAPTSSPIQMQVPDMPDPGARMERAINMMKMSADIANTQADTARKAKEANLIDAQIGEIGADTELKRRTMDSKVDQALNESFTSFSQRQLNAYRVQAEEMKVEQTEIALAHDRLAQKKGFLDLSRAEQELAELKVAIEMKEYDLKYAKGALLPTGASPNMAATLPVMGGQLIGAVIEEVKKQLGGRR